MYNDSQYFYIKANDTLPALQIMLMTKGDLDQVLPFNLLGAWTCKQSVSKI